MLPANMIAASARRSARGARGRRAQRLEAIKRANRANGLGDKTRKLLLLLYAALTLQKERSSPLHRRRWESERLIDLAQREGSFVAEYRLDPRGFDMLLNLIRADLEKDTSFLGDNVEPISSDSRLGAALIMLGGGRYIEAMRTHGLAKATVYKNLHDVVKIINDCVPLAVTADYSSRGSCAEYASGFQARSKHGLFEYCVGAIDGLAIHIRAPRETETHHQTRFFSGSKKKHCLNMQAVCDANMMFTAVSCMHVGSTNDGDAFHTAPMRKLNESLPFPYHWNGDLAYILTEFLMSPYSGANLSEYEDSFNFYHSQIRILIECTFGIFISRWGIFWQPLKFALKMSLAIVHCAVRLHNFCRKVKTPLLPESCRVPEVARLRDDGTLRAPEWRNNIGMEIGENDARIHSGSTLREYILSLIESNKYRRPLKF